MLPPEFLERLAALLPAAQFEAVCTAYANPRVTSFRINTLKAERAPVLEQLKASGVQVNPLDWFDNGFWVASDERPALLASDVYRDQAIYVQNQASMIPPLVLAPRPGDRILDLAAAPGSKTLQIACMMDRSDEIAAVDAVKSRFFKLRENLKAQGAGHVRTFLKDGRGVWKHRPEYFDRVLLDAPCSSEGRFRVDEPASFAYWSVRKIREMVQKQRRLLQSAVHALRPGGTLVYSTCSLAPEENEGVLTDLLKKFGSAIEIVPVPFDVEGMNLPCESWEGRLFDASIQRARRILPSHRMEGFFVCKMKKNASTLPG
jgi:16S rRNA (cytosine1407-C5)-methyltransferase